jgi:O-antigen/teichoic acid export membrane protein
VSLKKNTLYNLLGAIAPLAIVVGTTPIYLKAIGNERYGVLALIWLLFGYFGLFDFGLSRATSNSLSLASNQAPSRQQELFTTAFILNTGLGVAAGMIFHLIGLPVLETFSKISSPLNAELARAVPWIAALLPISTMGSAVTGALESRERFLALNIAQLFGSLHLAVAPLLAVLWIEPSIEVAVAATAVSRAFAVFPIAILAWRQYEMRRPLIFRKETIKDLFAYGSWITATNMISPLLVSIDQFLIAGIKGAAALPYYSIPFSLASKMLILPNAAARALFPNISRQHAIEAKVSLIGYCETIGFLMSLICGPSLLVSHYALLLWIDSAFADNASMVFRIIVLGTWLNGIASVPYIYLQGQRRPDVPAKIHAAEIIPFIFLLWGMVTWLGLVGAALAWALRVAVDAALLLHFSGVLKNVVAKLLPLGVLQCGAFALSLRHHDLSTLVASTALLIIVTAIYGYLCIPMVKDTTKPFVSALMDKRDL